MKFTHWLGAFLMGTGLGLFLFALLITHNPLTSSYSAFVITSGSMSPAIPLGSVVFTKTIPAYKAGDIISFYSDGNKENLTTHRIFSVDNQTITTKGDANDSPDRLATSSDQIVGRVYLTIPYLGYAVDFAKTPKGFVALVIIPASIIIYEELKTIFAEIRSLLRKIFKGRGVTINKNLPRALFIFPLLGLTFLLVKSAGSFFSDEETATNNVLGTSETFGSPSPTPIGTPSPSSTPTSLPTTSPTPSFPPSAHIVINEIYYDVDGSHGSEPANEWLELYNPTFSAIDVSGWKLTDNSSQDIIPTSSPIPAGGFALIISQESTTTFWTIPAETIIINLGSAIDGGLNNGGDSLSIYDATNTLIDQITYPNGAVDEGHSLERDPDGYDSDNYSDFIDQSAPSPGS
jgi:signal peptidase